MYNLKTCSALTESQRDLIPSRLDVEPTRKGRGGGICDDELEKKVTDIITPMLDNQEKDISEVKDKMGEMEGIMYDIKRDLGLLTDQIAGIIEREESRVGGEETEMEIEMKAIIEDLESKFTRMESDLMRLLKDETTVSQLSKISEMFEEFKLNTITKSEFIAGIGDKADKEEIANIVS